MSKRVHQPGIGELVLCELVELQTELEVLRSEIRALRESLDRRTG